MIEPEHPTEQYISRRMEFHEAGEVWYRERGQNRLADWSKEQADIWRAKLPTRATLATASVETAGLKEGL